MSHFGVVNRRYLVVDVVWNVISGFHRRQKIKLLPQHFPSKGNINICQILVINFEDEVSIVEEILELLDTVVDTVALFFAGRLVQLGTLRIKRTFPFVTIVAHLLTPGRLRGLIRAKYWTL